MLTLGKQIPIFANRRYFRRIYQHNGTSMADETDNSDVELVDYNPELFVADGELWVRDRDAFPHWASKCPYRARAACLTYAS